MRAVSGMGDPMAAVHVRVTMTVPMSMTSMIVAATMAQKSECRKGKEAEESDREKD